MEQTDLEIKVMPRRSKRQPRTNPPRATPARQPGPGPAEARWEAGAVLFPRQLLASSRAHWSANCFRLFEMEIFFLSLYLLSLVFFSPEMGIWM